MAIGERLFMNNCAQCHGSDARGSKGFPNLTDKDWLGGGTPDIIKEHHCQGSYRQHAAHGCSAGHSEDVTNVAQYVLSLSGGPHDSVKAALGKAKFGVCAACHGPDGKGNPAVGAPNLTDDIWLHGFGEAAIVAMINNGKVNPDAGASRQADRRAGQCADGLCLGSLQQGNGRGQVMVSSIIQACQSISDPCH
jgi:cytochrome c oxidase cbb3-type subunit 3